MWMTLGLSCTWLAVSVSVIRALVDADGDTNIEIFFATLVAIACALIAAGIVGALLYRAFT